MEFRDLKKQYQALKKDVDRGIAEVIESSAYIHGHQVEEVENKLADYVGVKHCITCANGTDALQLALMAWGISEGDIVFVPDFTFFSSGEVVSAVGAIPMFVDVDEDTFNMSPVSLRRMVQKVISNGGRPKAVIAVDLYGQPANYSEIKSIVKEYDLLLLEDAAQGFGGEIKGQKACSFGDISTTSFFPAKPLGCYGDGGAIFTNNDEWASLIRSFCVHGKGESKYDNIRIGMNSRLDTIQAAVLLAKLNHFAGFEMDRMQVVADWYTSALRDVVETPVVRESYRSSWAQYTIKLKDKEMRDDLSIFLKEKGIPTAVYYQKEMHKQKAFCEYEYEDNDYKVTTNLCAKVLSLPFHPYLEKEEVELVTSEIKAYVEKN